MATEIVIGQFVASTDFYPLAIKAGYKIECFNSEPAAFGNVKITPVKGLITKAEFNWIIKAFRDSIRGCGY